MSHPVLGEEPVAVVQDLNGHSRDEAMDAIVDRLGPESELGGVATLGKLGLEDFPLNSTGKIMKRYLAPEIESLRSSS